MFITEDTVIDVRQIEVLGILEFENDATRQYVLKTIYFYVSGALICGSESDDFLGKLDIILEGNVNDPDYDIVDPPVSSGIDMGAKAIGNKYLYLIIN